jgi:hypothetical protein
VQPDTLCCKTVSLDGPPDGSRIVAMFLKAGLATIALFMSGLTLGFGLNWFKASSESYDLIWTDTGSGKRNVLGMTQEACERMQGLQAQGEIRCLKQPFLRFVASSF